MNNKFAENLKKIRKDNNLSQEQLAEELNVSRQAISKWESSIAYPEMDKIITIGEKFNINIDDLLHKDIREIKGEEETKKNLNKYVDEFLRFITNTIDMFSNMTFKSKIKCLTEQFIIGVVLLILFLIIGEVAKNLLLGVLWELLPTKIYYIILSILKAIYSVFCITISVMIMLHIYKTRYLDYYENIKKETKEEKEEVVEKEEPKVENKKSKLFFNKENNKIIIRDPKHSEYRFITAISKLIVKIIKFFTLCFSSIFIIALITLTFGLISSFLLYKTGFMFIGIIILIISLMVICILFILLSLNFIFDRKNNKKTIIWSFIISLLLIGLGSGLIFIGVLSFEYVEDEKLIYRTDYIELEMQENLFLENYYQDNEIEYIESNNSNIKIEFQIDKYSNADTYNNHYSGLTIYPEISNPIKLINNIIEDLNNKKVIPFPNNIKNIKVYTTRENIDKLLNNQKAYYDSVKARDEEIKYYEERINELEEQLYNNQCNEIE